MAKPRRSRVPSTPETWEGHEDFEGDRAGNGGNLKNEAGVDEQNSLTLKRCTLNGYDAAVLQIMKIIKSAGHVLP